MMNKCILLGVLLTAAMVASAQNLSVNEEIARLEAITAKCDALYVGQMELAVLVDKLPIREFDPITPKMRNVTRKSSAVEKSALDKLVSIRTSCDQLWDEFSPGISTKATSIAAIAALVDLRDGKTTFGEYARNLEASRRKNIENMNRLRRDEQERKRNHQEELNRTLSLSCIVNSAGPLNGVEFQYAINEVSQTVFANRGQGAPSNIVIGPTAISFHQKDSVVSISRSTGRFDISSPEYGALVSGQCQVITARRF